MDNIGAILACIVAGREYDKDQGLRFLVARIKIGTYKAIGTSKNGIWVVMISSSSSWLLTGG